jgi:2-polyprenyl-3-methyl-5-hydroxy-6-metoxy-1,4-benzoquinol methylase
MDKTKIAIALFDKYAIQYQEKYMDLGLYNDSLELFCKTVEREYAEILEIACGPGNITKYLLRKRPDFKILGIDLSSRMIGLAKINNPPAEFKIMDCRDIDKIRKKYNAVMCGFCLPYLSKEAALKLISDISILLKSNGVLYISTMEDDYNKSGWEGSSSGGGEKMYIHYHQTDYLTKALIENGFEILDLQRLESPGENKKSAKDLVILAKKFKTIT